MSILQSCCYWKSVREGSYASAFYTLIYFGLSTLVMLGFVNNETEFLTGQRNSPSGESILDRGDITKATVIFNIVFLCCAILLVVASMLLIVGLRYDKRLLLLPWIVLMLCDGLIELAHLVYLSIAQRVVFDPVVGFLFTMDFFLMCLHFYCLLCVISQYQEYRRGRGFCAARISIEAQSSATLPANVESPSEVCVRRSQLNMPVKQQPTVPTIPEEVDQNHKVDSSGEEPSELRDYAETTLELFQRNEAQQRLQIPIITLDTSSIGP